MKIMERRISKVKEGKWEELLEMEKKWDAVESRVGGFAPKRRYRPLAGAESSSMFVWEREWESFTAAEEAYTRMLADEEAKELGKNNPSLARDMRTEFFWVLD